MALLADELALCDSLQTALLAANTLDGTHAMQYGGTYGAIRAALVKALTVALVDNKGMGPRTAKRIAEDIASACAYNGESPSWNWEFYVGTRAA